MSSLEATRDDHDDDAAGIEQQPQDDEEESLKHKKERLKLDIDRSGGETSSGLMFSPGGSEAFMFPSSAFAIDQQESRKTIKGRGERPKTVGHADNDNNPGVINRINRKLLQGRLDDLRTSLGLEYDDLSSAYQSTEPSPRR